MLTTVQLPVLWSWEGKWRTSPEGDVTAPELVITGGNGGVKGHPVVVLMWLQHMYIEDFQIFVAKLW